MSAAVSVTAVGMACPLGLSARAACVAIRAGLNARRELPYCDDDGEPLTGAMLERLTPHRPRRERWLALACYALFDLLGANMGELLQRLPLIMVVSDEQAATPAGRERVRIELCAQLELELPARAFQIVVGGSSAGLRALADARARVASSGQPCVVLAADSMIDARSLHRLSQARRLLTPRQPDGFSPGEAAACVMLGPAAGRSWGRIMGAGSGHEPATLTNDLPLRAQGLVEAVKGALAEAGLGLHDIDFRVSDAAGESFAFKEQALLPARLLRQRKVEFPLWLSANSLGHLGCASGVCGLVIALDAMVRGHAPGSRALLLAGDDEGERAAMVVVGG